MSVDGDQIRERARLGMVVLGVRSVLQQVAVFGGSILLARLLDPGDYGIFAIVQVVLMMFTVFGDAGLAASLIQKEVVPTQRELSSVWWVQLMLAVVVVVAIYFLSPLVLAVWPDVPQGTEWLLRALSISFGLTLLRVIPTILMERELDYVPLAIVELSGSLVYYGAAVGFAYFEYGAWSFVYAVIARDVVALVLSQSFRPWRPSLVLDRGDIRGMLEFSLSYHGKTIVGLANGIITPIFAGGVIGKRALGLNNFAQQTAYFPLQVVNIVGRVTFPLFSRLQNDKASLARELTISIQLCGLATFFFVAVLLGVGPMLVEVVYSPKWLPAMPALYVYVGAISVGFLAPIVAAAFDGLGKPQLIFRLAMVWTALNWIAMGVWYLRFEHTVLNFAIAYAVHVVVGNLMVVVLLRREVPELSLVRTLKGPVAAAAIMAAVGRFLLLPWVGGPLTLAPALLVVSVGYVALTLVFDRSLLEALKTYRARQEKKKRQRAARRAAEAAALEPAAASGAASANESAGMGTAGPDSGT